ncbi:hypothetical protein QBC32DRAFT_319467 [Pseudoneurospora amorphoporcata]|uniref:Uncharacterized protein n=1 Tax=Pseudoneurospora amorphoporcata TaxID=241081 RepID=A0AAN6NJX2_9PEZI|nr:hypothetical protein QBC32DRAFT_319467 [Pseudoneurospora amorphoporcata]
MKPQLLQHLFLSTLLGLCAANVVKAPAPRDLQDISNDSSLRTHTLSTKEGKRATAVSYDEEGKLQGTTIVL